MTPTAAGSAPRPAGHRPLPLRRARRSRRRPATAAGDRVSGVTLASGEVRPGDLYAALPGARTHGARFAADAAARGAVAVLTDPAGARTPPRDRAAGAASSTTPAPCSAPSPPASTATRAGG